MKRMLIGFIVAAMFLAMAMPAVAAEGADVISSGTDSGCRWELRSEESGLTLYLFANGETVVPESAVKTMGWRKRAAEITKLVIAKEFTEIQKAAFSGMTALTEVEFEQGSQLTNVYQKAFSDCTALKELHFGDELVKVWQNAFLNCTSLEILDLGRGSSEGFTLGDTVTKYCVNLRTLILPEKILRVGENAFNLVHQIENIYWYGTSLESWDEMMLRADFDPDYLADSDNELYLYDAAAGDFSAEPVRAGQLPAGKGVTAYRNSAYPDKALVLSGGGEMPDYEDGASAPWSDTRTARPVTTVVIMDSLKAIGENAFADCADITAVIYYGTEDQWSALIAESGEGNDQIFNNPAADVTFAKEGPLSDSTHYKLEPIEDSGYYELTIGGTADMVEMDATKQPWFHVRHLITSVVIEEGVSSVGSNTFYRMRNIEKVSIPSTVTVIGTYAFRYCVGLKEVTIPEGVENLGFGAFHCCAGLETISLPTTLKTVDMKCFEYCVNLKTVNYAGFDYQWSAVGVDNSGKGNQYMVDAELISNETPQVTVYSDAASSAHIQQLQFLYQRELIQSASKDRLGLDLTMKDEEVYRILYLWAGADNRYSGPEEWARVNGLLEGDYGYMTPAKLDQLIQKVAVYNGYSVELPGATDTSPMTREAGFARLAEFFQSAEGTANRYDRITAQLRAGLEENRETGNGQLYITSPNLFVPNLGKKVGDCTLVIFPDGQTMLIDAGIGSVTDENGNTRSTSDMLLPFLEEVGITSLDYFVLTHGHSDHYGGAKDVFKYIQSAGGTVKNYWYGCEENDTKAGNLKEYLTEKFHTVCTMVELAADGQEYLISHHIGGVQVDIFGPTRAVNESALKDWGTVTVNNSSVCLKLTFGEAEFLSCGDIYVSREEELVAAYGPWLHADVMKANHHGNYQSNGQSWVDTVKAEVYIAEIDGTGNAMVAERVKNADGEYYTTGYDGMVMVCMSNDGSYELMPQYDGNLRRQAVAEVDLTAEPEPAEDPVDMQDPTPEKYADWMPVMVLVGLCLTAAAVLIFGIHKKPRR